MAKNEKKTSVVDFKDITTENVAESLKSANVFGEGIVALSDENDTEETKKRKARDLSALKTKANYQNTRLVLAARFNKKCLKAQEDARNASLALVDRVKKGELTLIDYDEEMSKVIDESVKKVDEAGKEFEKLLRELREAVPGGCWYEYENPFRRISSAIEKYSRTR